MRLDSRQHPKHAVKSGRTMRQLAGAGFAAGTAALVVLAAATSSGAAPSRTVRHPITAQELALCRSAVTALLGNELLQVSAGRPDVGVDTRDLIMSANHANPALGDRIQIAQQRLMLTASGDLLTRYGMDVPRELAAYSPQIVTACSTP